MSGAKIQNSDELRSLIAGGGELVGVDASGADLTGVDLAGQNLSRANFRYADLSRANLRNAYLRGANLRHARLVGTDLRGADMRNADVSFADLLGAILGETRMQGLRAEGVRGVKTEVFFPIKLLDELLERPGVILGDRDLTIPGDGVENYHVVRAFRIVEPEGAQAGNRKLLGKVLSVDQIKEQGGEVAGTSVILGDVAYRCEEGYLGTPATGRAVAQPLADTRDAETKSSDLELLKGFLLNKLE